MTIEKILDAIRDQQAMSDEGALLVIEAMIEEFAEDRYDVGYDRGRDDEYLEERGY